MVECPNLQWKKIVNKTLLTKNRNDLLEVMVKKNYKKIDIDEMSKENFEMKKYMSQLTMHSARTKFALRTKMTKNVKMNFKNDPANKRTLWKCDDCSSIDSQEHILWCPAYGHLRIEKDLDNDKDLTWYFQQVLKSREK